MNTSHAPAPTFRLWLMMVLEFAIWGAWLPLIWGYMGKDGLAFTDSQIAWVGSAFAIASIVGIFFSSQFADRTFAAEKFMAFSHFVGGLAILAMYWAGEIAAATGLGVFAVFSTSAERAFSRASSAWASRRTARATSIISGSREVPVYSSPWP